MIDYDTDTNTETEIKSDYELLLDKYNNKEKELDKKIIRVQREYKRDIDILLQKIDELNKIVQCVSNTNNLLIKRKSNTFTSQITCHTGYNTTSLILDFSNLNDMEYYDLNNIQFFYQLEHLTIKNYHKKEYNLEERLINLKNDTLKTLCFDTCTFYSNTTYEFIKKMPELETIEFIQVRFYFEDELKLFNKNINDNKKPLVHIFGIKLENNNYYIKHPKISKIILDGCTKINSNMLYYYCKNNNIKLHITNIKPPPYLIKTNNNK